MSTHDDLSYDNIMSKDILDILGLVDLPDDEKDKLKGVMGETIKNRIISRVVDALSEEDLKTWESLQTADEKIKFLSAHNASLERFALEEALMYKYELAKLVQEMRNRAKHD